jgi:quercetin dioxygenase-like cupin family protein
MTNDSKNTHTYHMIDNLSVQLTEIPDDSIISKTIHQDEIVKVIQFGFSPGQELSEHTASMPAIIHIIEGEMLLTLGENQMKAKEGTWVYMQAQLPHSLMAICESKMLLYLLKNVDS